MYDAVLYDTDMVNGKKLNKEQLQAIKHESGPLLIIAGAGTGKTTVVTERIKYLIEKELAKPSEILALTFTEKAAREMEDRVDQAMPYGYTQMWISTFHSFCDRVLRSDGLHIGFDPKYRLMTGTESTQLIRDHLFEFDLDYFRPLGNPNKYIAGMLTHFSRLQDENVTPEDYLKWARKQQTPLRQRATEGRATIDEQILEARKWQELASSYKKYDELKIKNSAFDFGDLIIKTVELFKKRPNILKNYQEQFKYILVDEFQDTNYVQNELAMMLAGKKANITVVGDDDQAIYRFRGAAVSNILQFRKTYKKAKTVVLSQNYRSYQEILDKSYALIQNNNPDRLEIEKNVNKELVATRKSPTSREASRDDTVTFIHENRVENEADRVAREIIKLTEKSYQFSDIAILVRANAHADSFTRSLERSGIPYQFLGPGKLFRQEEVVDLVSYLRVLYDLTDSISFYRVLAMDNFEISPRELVNLSNTARKNHLSLFEAAEESENEKIKMIIGIINNHLKILHKESAGQLLYDFLEQAGILPDLINPDNIGAQKKAKNISKLFDKLKTYEIDHEDATVRAVVDWIELASELGESPLAADIDWMDNEAVNILTIHSAKGLEFPVVFLVNLVSLRFPSMDRREQIPIPDELIKENLPVGDYHLQEERRLFYVGMTRSRDKLYLTAANYYGEGKREKKLSQFIFEALGEDATSAEQTNNVKQLSFLDYNEKEKLSTPRSPALPAGRFSEVGHIDYLSYSQIETFKICPLHYKLRYLLKIPTPPSAALSMGSSVHAALKDFYLELLHKKATEKLLLNALKNNWIPAGYLTKSHETKSFKKAEKYLKDYYKEHFDPKALTIAIEKPFVVPLTPKKGERRLKIGGVIDRVDDLGGGKIEIIDYKTGSRVPSQREVDSNDQLTFYALAATKIFEQPFGRKPNEVKLSLYYFEEQIKISTVRSIDQLKKAEEEIYKVRNEIEESDFECSGHIFCENCEYSLFCRVEK